VTYAAHLSSLGTGGMLEILSYYNFRGVHQKSLVEHAVGWKEAFPSEGRARADA
jgi:hypothetical protein